MSIVGRKTHRFWPQLPPERRLVVRTVGATAPSILTGRRTFQVRWDRSSRYCWTCALERLGIDPDRTTVVERIEGVDRETGRPLVVVAISVSSTLDTLDQLERCEAVERVTCGEFAIPRSAAGGGAEKPRQGGKSKPSKRGATEWTEHDNAALDHVKQPAATQAPAAPPAAPLMCECGRANCRVCLRGDQRTTFADAMK